MNHSCHLKIKIFFTLQIRILSCIAMFFLLFLLGLISNLTKTLFSALRKYILAFLTIVGLINLSGSHFSLWKIKNYFHLHPQAIHHKISSPFFMMRPNHSALYPFKSIRSLIVPLDWLIIFD